MTSTRLQAGDLAPNFTLPSIDGTTHDLSSYRGQRLLLAFFRFASCPFCNLRVRELVQQVQPDAEFAVLALFRSPLDALQKHAQKHAAPFPILSDEQGGTYAAYGIERSVAGFMRGMFLRAPTLVHGMAQGFFPTNPHGSLTTMPADFLIDERGTIQTAYYGDDEGDHLDVSAVNAFARGERIGGAAI